MLERTAAGLESCGLQRVLSKPGRSSKRGRHLHTGFWQHGASAIELSSIWPARNRGKEEQDLIGHMAPPVQTGLFASAFLLDFLYPSGTYALLRRLYPTLPRPQDGQSQPGVEQRRNFTPHTIVADADASVTLFRCGENVDRRTTRIRKFTSRSDDMAMKDCTNSVADTETDCPSFGPSDSTTNNRLRMGRETHLQTLTDLLSRPEEALYHDVWDVYSRLDQQQRQSLRSPTVVYLSTSQSIVDIGRAISVLRQIPVQSWDDNLQAAGILLHLRAGDQEVALDVFNKGLHSRASGAGLEHLMENALLNKEWAVVLKIWLEYFSIKGRESVSFSEFSVDNIAPMTSLSNLAELYFAFETYLETDAAGPVKATTLYMETNLGLEALRRWMARQVLQRPCPPRQARAILQIWNDPVLYQHYLVQMLHRWEDGLETRAGLAALSDIYSNYRKLEGVKTPVSLLHKMFDFYYPSDTAGLAEVYHDWHQASGDLDQRGYEKFLKFYSTSGDVPAVKDLWARYITKFPSVVKRPLGFRSTMNAFAQAGNIEGAEREFQTMVDNYGVKPDINTWNTLLKCYSKADNEARAFECFEQIKSLDRPDAFTYAQVMALAAKRGDLATVLKFFDQSQQDDVPISREMTLSLVMVYCHNDRLKDAEKICTEFAERGVTSAAVWNQLIYFNGHRGNLNKCYALLESMKKYGVEWDHQTHEFLLRAMVHVDQIQSAFQLLQTAREDGLFPIGPEHFAVVMSGAVRAGQLDLADTIYSRMQSAGFHVPFKAQLSLAQASIRRKPSAERSRAMSRDVVGQLIASLSSTRARRAPGETKLPEWTALNSSVQMKAQTGDIGRAIMLLVEQRDFAGIEKIMSAYLSAFPEHKGEKTFPPEIASALMCGYMKDDKLDRVHKMWKQTFDAAIRSSTNASRGIYPAHQHDLTRPLNVVIKAFKATNDGDGLLKTVDQVLGSGFKLTRTNWNLAIRHLADLGHWERAMDWCEQMLMAHWRGWTSSAKSLQERRSLKNNRILIASKATVFSLQKEWLKLRKLAAWSGEVSSKLKDIERRHPKLHQAFITTDYEHLPATWVLPKKPSMTKAIKEMLRPLSYDELVAMRKALEKQLRLEKKHRHVRKGKQSPFHVVAGPGKAGQVVTKAVTSRDLEALDAALREELDENDRAV